MDPRRFGTSIFAKSLVEDYSFSTDEMGQRTVY
jgi:hypothetical protein